VATTTAVVTARAEPVAILVERSMEWCDVVEAGISE